MASQGIPTVLEVEVSVKRPAPGPRPSLYQDCVSPRNASKLANSPGTRLIPKLNAVSGLEARDGSVKYFIPDSCSYPYAAGSSMAEGVTVDADGNVYGAEFVGTIRKFVKK